MPGPVPGSVLAGSVTPLAPVGGLDPEGYVPGACNIGPMEIRRRRGFAIVGLAAAAVLFVALVLIGAPAWSRALVMLPLMGGIFSWLQARRRFCAAFAWAGIANFGATDGERRHVQDADARRADLAAIRRMMRDAFLLALPITIVAVLLPV